MAESEDMAEGNVEWSDADDGYSCIAPDPRARPREAGHGRNSSQGSLRKSVPCA
jgi:hypothetical protein